MTKKYNPNDKYGNLYYISKALNSLHKCNLIHRDLHSGNLLLSTDMFTHISDLGLSQPADGSTKPDEIYGVLPYIAPEVLRGNPYTKASDIYSFGIIMWEMTSGVPAFSNVPHEFELCYDICRGLRPRIVEGTEVEYVNLMKRCWDGDPENRPTSLELIEYFKKWRHIYKFNYLERVNVPVNELIRHHPKACYTSRRIGYSAKLNEMLLRQSNHHNRFDSQADCILTPEDIENAQTEYFSMNQMMNIENIENN
ncbi:kinase-like domain-containing protein [Glomus cerebriforme]|uniref:Kinase-like domain-containing protein n=1 Tax=Glomus cerebriforme TaxID=658196 RepID=A0A397SEK7_9GLOM|nr:kinase-like domain-containing protein [Glomus cerebriforme]